VNVVDTSGWMEFLFRHRVPMADSLILSTAWSEQATLWTQDEHFAGLPGVEYRAARTKASSARGRPRR
jgi:predicted nucleic acid-binding protein